MNNVYLAHHGIKGQKWGERKYQYKDGSLTPEGRKRYGVLGSTKAYIHQRQKNVEKFYKESKGLGDDKLRSQMTKKERDIYDKADAAYKKRQKKAGRQFRSDLKRGFEDKKRIRLEKQAKRGGNYSLGDFLNASRRTGQGAAAGRLAGKALIKTAMARNPNLKISDADFKRLVKQAEGFGANLGLAYSRIETAQGYRARQKLNGDRNKY